MQLQPGTRLGPYEVLAPLGAGGMGEVYRARDPRLGRDVALKIVAASGTGQADRFRRFEQEARAVAALNHPHVMSIYDVGSENGVHYVVFELLEGRTLRERLEQGSIPHRKAVEYGVQIGRGLAAAHARGVIHRDLKPDNLLVTNDGQIKILDFGLAKLSEPLSGDLEAPTLTATDPGLVVGTAGYTSPEQLRGEKAAARSDIFALGAILYEMLSGLPAFGGPTRADRSSAVLHHDPPELTSSARDPVSPGLERIVRRCLEKDPEERLQTALDVAFALEALGGSSARETAPDIPRPLARRLLRAGAAGLIVAAAVAASLWTGSFLWRRPVARTRQLTFRRGNITGAHFAPDEHTVVYSAAWDGKPSEIFTTRLDGPGSRALGLPPARLLSVSPAAELAILLTKPGEVGFPVEGTLARVPLSGGVPRQVLEDVQNADWSPDGKELAVVRRVGSQSQLEYPLGTVLWRDVPESVDHWVRVSPHGDQVAYLSEGEVTIIDRSGGHRSIAIEPRANGLAWSPAGDGVWVTMSEMDSSYAIWRVGLDGTRREVYQAPGSVILHDVGRSGSMLVHHGFEQMSLRVKARGETAERDLVTSLLGPRATSISADGSHLVLRNPDGVFLCPTRGGEPVSLARGNGGTISPDGKWVAMWPAPDHEWTLEPTGPGEPRRLSLGNLRHTFSPDMFLDSNRLVFWGSEPPASSSRGFVLEVATGILRPVTPLGVTNLGSPAVKEAVLARQADGTLAWYPISGGEPRPTRARVPEDTTSIRTTQDGRWTFVGDWRGTSAPIRIDRIDLFTGRREAWRTFGPEDMTGVALMFPQFPMTSDGEAYAYNYLRVFQDLFLVEGLR